MFVSERILEKQGYSDRKELFGKIVKNWQCLSNKWQLLSVPEGDTQKKWKNKVSTYGNKGNDLKVLKI